MPAPPMVLPLLLLWLGLAAQAAGLPEARRHEVMFTGFDGTRFEFRAYHKAMFNVLSERDHQVNAVFADKGSGYAVVQALAFKFRTSLQLLVVSSASAANTSVALTVMVGKERLRTSEARKLSLRLAPTVELAYARKRNGDERVMVTTPSLTLYVTKYADVPNIDFTFDLPDALVGDMRMHGVLGQTLHWVGKEGRKLLDGDETAYMVGGIFEDDFKYNKFVHGR